jgi:glycosyltransferase involved in cell wall biosynthesis
LASPRPSRKRGEGPLVGMLGHWQPIEGQEVVLKAMRLLRDRGRRMRLRIIGEASTAEEERYRSVVSGMIKAAGLHERVILEAAVGDLSAFIAECDLLVVPPMQPSSGRLVLEAAACSRPVIASRVDGLAEIIEDGHTGLLVPPNDPRALADALELALASPPLRAEMGRQARVRAEERYALESMLDALEALWRDDRAAGMTTAAPMMPAE